MESIPNFNTLIEKSIKEHWNQDALTDYKGITLQYHDVARKIEKLHIMFESSGVQKGDKIALCGRNSAGWASAFLATLTYGAVAVPILHEFTADQIHNIVNHSEAKLLFAGDVVSTQVDPTKMPGIEGIIYIPDYSLLFSRSDRLTYAREHLNEMFGKKYPKYFRQEHVVYYKEQSPEDRIPMRMHVVRIDDICFATNRFELYQDFQHRMQARSPFLQTFVIQLAGEEGGSYLPTERAQKNKGYGSSFYENKVGFEGGQQIVEETLRILNELKAEDEA